MKIENGVEIVVSLDKIKPFEKNSEYKKLVVPIKNFEIPNEIGKSEEISKFFVYLRFDEIERDVFLRDHNILRDYDNFEKNSLLYKYIIEAKWDLDEGIYFPYPSFQKSHRGHFTKNSGTKDILKWLDNNLKKELTKTYKESSKTMKMNEGDILGKIKDIAYTVFAPVLSIMSVPKLHMETYIKNIIRSFPFEKQQTVADFMVKDDKVQKMIQDSFRKDVDPKIVASNIERLMKNYKENFIKENKMRKLKNQNTMVEIKEEFHIPGTDVILEEGDRIQVVKQEEKILKEEKISFQEALDMIMSKGENGIFHVSLISVSQGVEIVEMYQVKDLRSISNGGLRLGGGYIDVTISPLLFRNNVTITREGDISFQDNSGNIMIMVDLN